MSAMAQRCTAAMQQRTTGQAERSRAAVSSVAPQPVSRTLAGGQSRREQRQHRRHSIVVTAASSSAAVAEPPAAAESWKPSNAELKAALLDSLFGTERGLSANSELRAEINELITQLEAGSPNAAPNEVTDLNGEWKLVYTSNSELTALLALSRLPFVTVGDITQTIDGPSLTVINKVQLTVPFSRTAFSSKASFEVRSPKLLNIKFEQGTVQTPELLQDVEIPESVTVLGQSIDLTTLKAALQPVTTSLRSAVEQAARFVSQQPDLQFPIKSDRAQSWLLTTYLDEDTRIARGDGGSVFVMVKEVSLSSATVFEAADLGTTADIAFGATPAMTVSASAAPSSIGSDFGATAAPSSGPGFGVTTAGGYADEVTPDAPTTTDPTLPGDYVDEVTPDASAASTGSSAAASSAEGVITPGASAPDTIIPPPPDYTTDVSTRGEY